MVFSRNHASFAKAGPKLVGRVKTIYAPKLVRRTSCFCKTERMPDLVIGLFINRYEFGRLL
jgi:hypothetical protein